MTNLDSILKSRNITLPFPLPSFTLPLPSLTIPFCIVKAMAFPVMRYRCESWTVKMAEHRRIDAFELWC